MTLAKQAVVQYSPITEASYGSADQAGTANYRPPNRKIAGGDLKPLKDFQILFYDVTIGEFGWSREGVGHFETEGEDCLSVKFSTVLSTGDEFYSNAARIRTLFRVRAALFRRYADHICDFICGGGRADPRKALLT